MLVPQTTFTGDLVGRKVAVTGTYDADGQLLVTGRAHDGTTGLLVLTPLTTSDGAVLPVVRGWVATAADADAPPAGTVDVTGYLQASEQAGTGVADGRTDAISSAELLNSWGGPIYTGYLVVASSDPAQSDVRRAARPADQARRGAEHPEPRLRRPVVDLRRVRGAALAAAGARRGPRLGRPRTGRGRAAEASAGGRAGVEPGDVDEPVDPAMPRAARVASGARSAAWTPAGRRTLAP